MIIVGDLNTRLAHPREKCEDDVVTGIATHGLEDQTHHFFIRFRYRGEKGWM